MSAPEWCKVCRQGPLRGINVRLRRGDTLRSIVAWCAVQGFPVTRQKLAHHRDNHMAAVQPSTAEIDRVLAHFGLRRV